MVTKQPYPNRLDTVSIPGFLLWKPYRNTETQTETKNQTRDRDPCAHSPAVSQLRRRNGLWNEGACRQRVRSILNRVSYRECYGSVKRSTSMVDW